MDETSTQSVVDDIDDVCSCDSVYHSLIDTLGGAQSLVPVTTPAEHPPIETAFSIPEPDAIVRKDDRSHQRARQRLKKPDDIFKAKRCACKACRPSKWAGNGGRPKERGKGLRASFAEAEGERTLEKSVELAYDDDDDIAAPQVIRNVSLADLVKAPRKGSDKRFEMVGRPRQVLVLDEFSETGPTRHDFDEWEQIEVEVKHRKAMAPSYARVVANRA